MKYTFYDNSIRYINTEASGTSLIMIETKQSLVLNSTGMDILRLLPASSNIAEIMEKMQVRYPHIEKEVLQFDVNEMLRVFEIYGIIQIHDKIDAQAHDGEMRYVIAGDIDYKSVSAFLGKSIGTPDSLKHFQEKNLEYYSPISLRYRTMSNKEYGAYAAIGNCIRAYMSVISPSDGVSAVLLISTLFFDEGLRENEISELLSGMLNRLLRPISTQIQINKVRIAFIDESIEHDKIIKILKTLGFGLECTLDAETVNGNVFFYVLYLKSDRKSDNPL